LGLIKLYKGVVLQRLFLYLALYFIAISENMPKPRTKGRIVKKRVFIVCEGSKTEPNYFNHFLEDFNFRGRPVEITVVDTEKNTAVELVEVASKMPEFLDDELWAVFDKDGYTKHETAFALAKEKNVNIAFSSISFEYWILLHFQFVVMEFKKSREIIDYMRKMKFLSFKKNDTKAYNKIKQFTDRAISNSKKIQHFYQNQHINKPIYELNPYCNVNELIESIRRIAREYR